MDSETLEAVRRAKAGFKESPPTPEDLVRLARDYAKAFRKWSRVYDQVDTVRGLDEFDPKSVAWENRLYKADMERQRCKEVLLAASLSLPSPRPPGGRARARRRS